jgi:hypothetical protein
VSNELEWRCADAALAAQIGKAALVVWAALLKARGENDLTHITLRGVCRLASQKLSEHQVRRALARLKTLGIVTDIGWEHTEVPCSSTERSPLLGNVREVYSRRVVGSARVGEVGLPSDVWHKVERSVSHGGRRKGAGRPARIKSHGVPCGLNTGPQVPENTKERIKPHGRCRNKKEDLIFLPSEERCAAARRLSSSSEEGVSQVDGLPVESDEHGSLLLGTGLPPRISSEAWSLLPPYPGIAAVKPATIPSPPMVPPEASEEECVKMLLAAYGTTLRRKMPREFNPHSKHAPKGAERALLVKAAAALRQHNVSPLRWCEFSFDIWQHGREADKAAGKKQREARPALRVVFALKRIEETAGWARSEYERRGERVVLTRTLRTLLDKHAAMTARVLGGRCTPQEAMAEFFPDDTYARLVEKARAEARREQEAIDTRLSAGEYLW